MTLREEALTAQLKAIREHLSNIEAQLIAARIAYLVGNWDALRQALDIKTRTEYSDENTV